MSNVEASKPNQGERYVDGVPPSPTAAVELELAIYERLEKARKVECDLAKDGENRRNLRNQKLCIVAMLLLAIIVAIAIGVTRTAKITEDDPVDFSEVKTNGPFTRDDLRIMLVGVPSETDLTSEATRTLEENYCAFFVQFYNKPHELDWLRANLDIAECSVEVLEIERRRLNEDMSSGTDGLVIQLNQTLMLREYPNSETFTYGIKAFINHVVSEPFKDDVAVASFVKKLKNQSPSTDEFSSLVDIRFAPESTATAESQSPVSVPTGIPPAVTQVPSKSASIAPPSANPTKAPTPKPTNLPREDEKDKDEKGKDKKKNAKGKV
jgi:hypothetical protein